VVIACSFVTMMTTGCESVQRRMTQRSARCGALCARAQAARERGNADQADRYLNEALLQKPSDPDSRRQLVETMWMHGRRDEAIAEFASLCDEHPKDAKLAERLAVMQWETSQYAAAMDTAMNVLQLDPKSKDAWLIKGRYEMATAQLDEALTSYIRLSQVAPGELATLAELGELHLRRGHADRACPLFREAMNHPETTEQQRAEIEWMLGIAYSRSERWSSAVPFLEQAMTRRTATAEDWCVMGWAHLQSGNVVGAQADLKQARQRNPDSPEVQRLAKQLHVMTAAGSDNDEVRPVSHQQRS